VKSISPISTRRPNLRRCKIKKIHLQYFAILRDERGLETETVEVQSETYLDLYNELKSRHGFSLPAEMIQIAVNDQFAKLDMRIADDSRVVFIPPVAGG
jgi:molybdopterin synthase sulfur carrier subunit